MITECRHYQISGHVQGVFFRKSTQKEAKTLAIKGWVRNNKNGDVEVVACGTEATLAIFEQFLEKGPPKAEVDKVDKTIIPFIDFTDFEIR